MIPSQVRGVLSQSIADLPVREEATSRGYSAEKVHEKEVFNRCDCYYRKFCNWGWKGKPPGTRQQWSGTVYWWKSCWAQGDCKRNGPKHQPNHWWCKSTYSPNKSGKPDRVVWSGNVSPY